MITEPTYFELPTTIVSSEIPECIKSFCFPELFGMKLKITPKVDPAGIIDQYAFVQLIFSKPTPNRFTKARVLQLLRDYLLDLLNSSGDSKKIVKIVQLLHDKVLEECEGWPNSFSRFSLNHIHFIDTTH